MMNPKDHKWQVSSLELSKKLRKLGVKQDSLWYWVKTHTCYTEKENFELVYVDTKDAWINSCPDTEVYSAFTIAELEEMLPNKFYTIYLSPFKRWACFKSKDDGSIWTDHELSADTEANARAKMLVYLKENKLIKALK